MKNFKGLKAQSGIELAVYFGFLLVLLIIFSMESANKTQAIRMSRDSLEADKIGGLASTHINIAVSVGDGYSATFYLPYGLTNSNYTLSIFNEEQRLEIEYGQNIIKAYPLQTSNITNSPRQGQNFIKNIQGEIIFE